MNIHMSSLHCTMDGILQKYNFPRVTDGDMEEIETMGVKKTKINHERKNEADRLEYHEPYFGPIQIFNIQASNTRIMKSIIVPTEIVEEHLSGDKLLESKSFLSTKNRHSNTTPQDLSEI